MKGALQFVVTVSAMVESVETVGKDWAKVGQEVLPGTDKLADKFDYTPQIQKPIRRTVEIYKQTVDELDIAKIAAVVNGVKPHLMAGAATE